MAFDSSPTPPTLAEETLAALRTALATYTRDGHHSTEVREALSRVSAEAHEKGIPAERLLVMLKDVWHSLLEVRTASKIAEAEQRKLLQQLVTWCIREYYGE